MLYLLCKSVISYTYKQGIQWFVYTSKYRNAQKLTYEFRAFSILILHYQRFRLKYPNTIIISIGFYLTFVGYLT